MTTINFNGHTITASATFFEIKSTGKTVTAWGSKAAKAFAKFNKLTSSKNDQPAKIWICEKICNGF